MKILTFPFSLILIALLIGSCSPERQKDTGQVDSLRTAAEQLIKAQSLMGWNNWAFGKPSNQDSLYKSNAHLFTIDNINLVRETEEAEPDSVQKKRLRYFRRYLTTEFIAKDIAPLTDSVSNIEASATLTFEGKTIPYRQLSSLLSNEKQQGRRRGLYIAAGTVLDSLNATLSTVEKKSRSIAQDLGYASYNAMAEDLKQFSLDEFKVVAEKVLADTDSLYTTLLKEMLARQLGLTVERFYRFDIGRLLRVQQFDKYFTAASMMDVVRKTYLGLGVNIEAQTNLKIDAESREKKNPRAVCYPIDVPNDIRLSIRPIGGFDDYSSLFHEMGHGQHYANTKENAFEFKHLGEPTVTECFAFLSEYILVNQAWLRQHSSMPTPVLKDFVRARTFQRLYLIRRYAAKFLYELQLHGGAPNPQVIYATTLSNAMGYQRTGDDEKRYLTDVDALYYSAGYLRAWFLEAQLNEKLSLQFGANWFESPQAGEYLRTLWATGDRYNGDEFVRLIGHDRISPDVLLAAIKRMVLFSTKSAA